MRFTRLITAVIALLTAAIVGFATTTPSNASAAAAETKPAHQISNFSSGSTSTANVFYAKGLAWTHKGQRVYIKYWTKDRDRSVTYKSVVSDPTSGRFVFKFKGPCGSKWYIVIPEDAQQRRTTYFTYGDSILHSYFGKITC